MAARKKKPQAKQTSPKKPATKALGNDPFARGAATRELKTAPPPSGPRVRPPTPELQERTTTKKPAAAGLAKSSSTTASAKQPAASKALDLAAAGGMEKASSASGAPKSATSAKNSSSTGAAAAFASDGKQIVSAAIADAGVAGRAGRSAAPRSAIEPARAHGESPSLSSADPSAHHASPVLAVDPSAHYASPVLAADPSAHYASPVLAADPSPHHASPALSADPVPHRDAPTADLLEGPVPHASSPTLFDAAPFTSSPTLVGAAPTPPPPPFESSPTLVDEAAPFSSSPTQLEASIAPREAAAATNASGGFLQSLLAAVRAGAGLASRATQVDHWGKDAALASSLRPLGDLLYDRYFRVQVEGAQHVPAGPCIIVANHAGALPLDGPLLHLALRRERPELPEARWLLEDQIFHAPFVGVLANRVGAVRANPENAHRLLDEGRPIIVFPEGFHGLSKPFSERYQLRRFGRGGYVKIAVRRGVPIVPVAIVGGEESMPLLAKLPGRFFGVEHLPITPPPLPTKWFIRFSPAFDLSDAPAQAESNLAWVERTNLSVRDQIEAMITDLLKQRQSIF